MFYKPLLNRSRPLFDGQFHQKNQKERGLNKYASFTPVKEIQPKQPSVPPKVKKGKKKKKNIKTNQKGEAATILTLIAVGIMTAGIFAGSYLSQKKTSVETRAQSATCPLTTGNNPRLTTGGICEATINFIPGNPSPAAPTRLVCALIDPSLPAGSQVVAGQKTMPTNYDYFNLTPVGKFPLKTPSNISSSKTYRLVVYQMNVSFTAVEPTDCVREQNYSGTDVQSLFGSSPAQPTATRVPTSPPQTTNTPIPSPTIVVQCTSTSVGGFCSKTNCSEAIYGGNYIPSYNRYNCDQAYGSDYVCCVREAVYSTPVPTWTPVPTSTPTPTTKPDAQATATPTPSPAQILDSCKGIESVSVSPATVGLNSAFNCIVRYDIGTSEKNIVCGLHKEDVDQWWPSACDTVPASGGTVTFPCSTGKAEISSLIGNGGQFRLFAFRNLPECTKGSNPFFALGVKQSGVFQIGQQSSSQTNLSSANVKMQSNCPAQPKMAQNYAQITVSGKTALIQTNLKADNQFNRLDANCL